MKIFYITCKNTNYRYDDEDCFGPFFRNEEDVQEHIFKLLEETDLYNHNVNIDDYKKILSVLPDFKKFKEVVAEYGYIIHKSKVCGKKNFNHKQINETY